MGQEAGGGAGSRSRDSRQEQGWETAGTHPDQHSSVRDGGDGVSTTGTGGAVEEGEVPEMEREEEDMRRDEELEMRRWM